MRRPGSPTRDDSIIFAAFMLKQPENPQPIVASQSQSGCYRWPKASSYPNILKIHPASSAFLSAIAAELSARGGKDARRLFQDVLEVLISRVR